MDNAYIENEKKSNKHLFYQDTLEGLRSKPKFMHSKYFYDKRGDRLFQQIMRSPEYYLTRSEMEIISMQAQQISETIAKGRAPFELIELGAGDGTKSIYLLRQLMANQYEFSYLPVDISENAIDNLTHYLREEIPDLVFSGLNGDYFELLKKVSDRSNKRKVILFMGGNIGNMNIHQAGNFCTKLKKHLGKNDMLVIGFDLKKNPQQILAAYNDQAGLTKAFNLNLLTRINRELGGNFDLNSFEHYASYDPESGACKSYLISLKDQHVQIGDTEPIHFSKHEHVFMEISQKYAVEEISELAATAEFRLIRNFFDANGFFVDSIWEAY